MCIYKDNGYEDRKDYLKCMAEDYGVDIETVLQIAMLYGPNEDFDGLLSSLEEIGYDYE